MDANPYQPPTIARDAKPIRAAPTAKPAQSNPLAWATAWAILAFPLVMASSLYLLVACAFASMIDPRITGWQRWLAIVAKMYSPPHYDIWIASALFLTGIALALQSARSAWCSRRG